MLLTKEEILIAIKKELDSWYFGKDCDLSKLAQAIIKAQEGKMKDVMNV